MIFAADDYLYKDLVDLTTLTTTAAKSAVLNTVDAPYKSSYGGGARIRSSFHPMNGGLMHLTARVLGVLPASTDAGQLNIELYTNAWDGTAGAMKDACEKKVAVFGPVEAKDIIKDDGIALDCILPENLGTKIQIGVQGTAFKAVGTTKPMLEVMIEEYSTVNG